jgi:hypothetical protein
VAREPNPSPTLLREWAKEIREHGNRYAAFGSAIHSGVIGADWAGAAKYSAIQAAFHVSSQNGKVTEAWDDFATSIERYADQVEHQQQRMAFVLIFELAMMPFMMLLGGFFAVGFASVLAQVGMRALATVLTEVLANGFVNGFMQFFLEFMLLGPELFKHTMSMVGPLLAFLGGLVTSRRVGGAYDDIRVWNAEGNAFSGPPLPRISPRTGGETRTASSFGGGHNENVLNLRPGKNGDLEAFTPGPEHLKAVGHPLAFPSRLNASGPQAAAPRSTTAPPPTGDLPATGGAVNRLAPSTRDSNTAISSKQTAAPTDPPNPRAVEISSSPRSGSLGGDGPQALRSLDPGAVQVAKSSTPPPANLDNVGPGVNRPKIDASSSADSSGFAAPPTGKVSVHNGSPGAAGSAHEIIPKTIGSAPNAGASHGAPSVTRPPSDPRGFSGEDHSASALQAGGPPGPSSAPRLGEFTKAVGQELGSSSPRLGAEGPVTGRAPANTHPPEGGPAAGAVRAPEAEIGHTSVANPPVIKPQPASSGGDVGHNVVSRPQTPPGGGKAAEAFHENIKVPDGPGSSSSGNFSGAGRELGTSRPRAESHPELPSTVRPGAGKQSDLTWEANQAASKRAGIEPGVRDLRETVKLPKGSDAEAPQRHLSAGGSPRPESEGSGNFRGAGRELGRNPEAEGDVSLPAAGKQSNPSREAYLAASKRADPGQRDIGVSSRPPAEGTDGAGPSARTQTPAEPTPDPATPEVGGKGRSDRSRTLDEMYTDLRQQSYGRPAPTKPDGTDGAGSGGAADQVKLTEQTPRTTRPELGRQLLSVDEHGNARLIKVSTESAMKGPGQVLGGPNRGAELPAEAPSAKPPETLRYTELRSDGSMAPTQLRRGEVPVHTEPVGGAVRHGGGWRGGERAGGEWRERFLTYNAKAKTWEVQEIGRATPPAKPAGAGSPQQHQLLRKNPDGSIDLLTFRGRPDAGEWRRIGDGERPASDGTRFHDLDPARPSVWRNEVLGASQKPEVQRLSEPGAGRRIDGVEVTWRQEPTSMLARHQETGEWSRLGGTEGVRSVDDGPSAGKTPAGPHQDQAQSTGNTHYRLDPESKELTPVSVKQNELDIADVGAHSGAVRFDTLVAKGGSDVAKPELTVQSDGSLAASGVRKLGAGDLRYDPATGEVRYTGAKPRPDGPGGPVDSRGKPISDGGGTSLRTEGRGSTTQTDESMTFVRRNQSTVQQSHPVDPDRIGGQRLGPETARPTDTPQPRRIPAGSPGGDGGSASGAALRDPHGGGTTMTDDGLLPSMPGANRTAEPVERGVTPGAAERVNELRGMVDDVRAFQATGRLGSSPSSGPHAAPLEQRADALGPTPGRSAPAERTVLDPTPGERTVLAGRGDGATLSSQAQRVAYVEMRRAQQIRVQDELVWRRELPFAVEDPRADARIADLQRWEAMATHFHATGVFDSPSSAAVSATGAGPAAPPARTVPNLTPGEREVMSGRGDATMLPTEAQRVAYVEMRRTQQVRIQEELRHLLELRELPTGGRDAGPRIAELRRLSDMMGNFHTSGVFDSPSGPPSAARGTAPGEPPVRAVANPTPGEREVLAGHGDAVMLPKPAQRVAYVEMRRVQQVRIQDELQQLLELRELPTGGRAAEPRIAELRRLNTMMERFHATGEFEKPPRPAETPDRTEEPVPDVPNPTPGERMVLSGLGEGALIDRPAGRARLVLERRPRLTRLENRLADAEAALAERTRIARAIRDAVSDDIQVTAAAHGYVLHRGSTPSVPTAQFDRVRDRPGRVSLIVDPSANGSSLIDASVANAALVALHNETGAVVVLRLPRPTASIDLAELESFATTALQGAGRGGRLMIRPDAANGEPSPDGQTVRVDAGLQRTTPMLTRWLLIFGETPPGTRNPYGLNRAEDGRLQVPSTEEPWYVEETTKGARRVMWWYPEGATGPELPFGTDTGSGDLVLVGRPGTRVPDEVSALVRAIVDQMPEQSRPDVAWHGADSLPELPDVPSARPGGGPPDPDGSRYLLPEDERLDWEQRLREATSDSAREQARADLRSRLAELADLNLRYRGALDDLVRDAEQVWLRNAGEVISPAEFDQLIQRFTGPGPGRSEDEWLPFDLPSVPMAEPGPVRARYAKGAPTDTDPETLAALPSVPRDVPVSDLLQRLESLIFDGPSALPARMRESFRTRWLTARDNPESSAAVRAEMTQAEEAMRARTPVSEEPGLSTHQAWEFQKKINAAQSMDEIARIDAEKAAVREAAGAVRPQPPAEAGAVPLTFEERLDLLKRTQPRHGYQAVGPDPQPITPEQARAFDAEALQMNTVEDLTAFDAQLLEKGYQRAGREQDIADIEWPAVPGSPEPMGHADLVAAYRQWAGSVGRLAGLDRAVIDASVEAADRALIRLNGYDLYRAVHDLRGAAFDATVERNLKAWGKPGGTDDDAPGDVEYGYTPDELKAVLAAELRDIRASQRKSADPVLRDLEDLTPPSAAPRAATGDGPRGLDELRRLSPPSTAPRDPNLVPQRTGGNPSEVDEEISRLAAAEGRIRYVDPDAELQRRLNKLRAPEPAAEEPGTLPRAPDTDDAAGIEGGAAEVAVVNLDGTLTAQHGPATAQATVAATVQAKDGTAVLSGKEIGELEPPVADTVAGFDDYLGLEAALRVRREDVSSRFADMTALWQALHPELAEWLSPTTLTGFERELADGIAADVVVIIEREEGFDRQLKTTAGLVVERVDALFGRLTEAAEQARDNPVDSAVATPAAPAAPAAATNEVADRWFDQVVDVLRYDRGEELLAGQRPEQMGDRAPGLAQIRAEFQQRMSGRTGATLPDADLRWLQARLTYAGELREGFEKAANDFQRIATMAGAVLDGSATTLALADRFRADVMREHPLLRDLAPAARDAVLEAERADTDVFGTVLAGYLAAEAQAPIDYRERARRIAQELSDAYAPRLLTAAEVAKERPDFAGAFDEQVAEAPGWTAEMARGGVPERFQTYDGLSGTKLRQLRDKAVSELSTLHQQTWRYAVHVGAKVDSEVWRESDRRWDEAYAKYWSQVRTDVMRQNMLARVQPSVEAVRQAAAAAGLEPAEVDAVAAQFTDEVSRRIDDVARHLPFAPGLAGRWTDLEMDAPELVAEHLQRMTARNSVVAEAVRDFELRSPIGELTANQRTAQVAALKAGAAENFDRAYRQAAWDEVEQKIDQARYAERKTRANLIATAAVVPPPEAAPPAEPDAGPSAEPDAGPSTGPDAALEKLTGDSKARLERLTPRLSETGQRLLGRIQAQVDKVLDRARSDVEDGAHVPGRGDQVVRVARGRIDEILSSVPRRTAAEMRLSDALASAATMFTGLPGAGKLDPFDPLKIEFLDELAGKISVGSDGLESDALRSATVGAFFHALAVHTDGPEDIPASARSWAQMRDELTRIDGVDRQQRFVRSLSTAELRAGLLGVRIDRRALLASPAEPPTGDLAELNGWESLYLVALSAAVGRAEAIGTHRPVDEDEPVEAVEAKLANVLVDRASALLTKPETPIGDPAGALGRADAEEAALLREALDVTRGAAEQDLADVRRDLAAVDARIHRARNITHRADLDALRLERLGLLARLDEAQRLVDSHRPGGTPALPASIMEPAGTPLWRADRRIWEALADRPGRPLPEPYALTVVPSADPFPAAGTGLTVLLHDSGGSPQSARRRKALEAAGKLPPAEDGTVRVIPQNLAGVHAQVSTLLSQLRPSVRDRVVLDLRLFDDARANLGRDAWPELLAELGRLGVAVEVGPHSGPAQAVDTSGNWYATGTHGGPVPAALAAGYRLDPREARQPETGFTAHPDVADGFTVPGAGDWVLRLPADGGGSLLPATVTPEPIDPGTFTVGASDATVPDAVWDFFIDYVVPGIPAATVRTTRLQTHATPQRVVRALGLTIDAATAGFRIEAGKITEWQRLRYRMEEAELRDEVTLHRYLVGLDIGALTATLEGIATDRRRLLDPVTADPATAHQVTAYPANAGPAGRAGHLSRLTRWEGMVVGLLAEQPGGGAALAGTAAPASTTRPAPPGQETADALRAVAHRRRVALLDRADGSGTTTDQVLEQLDQQETELLRQARDVDRAAAAAALQLARAELAEIGTTARPAEAPLRRFVLTARIDELTAADEATVRSGLTSAVVLSAGTGKAETVGPEKPPADQWIWDALHGGPGARTDPGLRLTVVTPTSGSDGPALLLHRGAGGPKAEDLLQAGQVPGVPGRLRIHADAGVTAGQLIAFAGHLSAGLGARTVIDLRLAGKTTSAYHAARLPILLGLPVDLSPDQVPATALPGDLEQRGYYADADGTRTIASGATAFRILADKANVPEARPVSISGTGTDGAQAGSWTWVEQSLPGRKTWLRPADTPNEVIAETLARWDLHRDSILVGYPGVAVPDEVWTHLEKRFKAAPDANLKSLRLHDINDEHTIRRHVTRPYLSAGTSNDAPTTIFREHSDDELTAFTQLLEKIGGKLFEHPTYAQLIPVATSLVRWLTEHKAPGYPTPVVDRFKPTSADIARGRSGETVDGFFDGTRWMLMLGGVWPEGELGDDPRWQQKSGNTWGELGQLLWHEYEHALQLIDMLRLDAADLRGHPNAVAELRRRTNIQDDVVLAEALKHPITPESHEFARADAMRRGWQTEGSQHRRGLENEVAKLVAEERKAFAELRRIRGGDSTASYGDRLLSDLKYRKVRTAITFPRIAYMQTSIELPAYVIMERLAQVMERPRPTTLPESVRAAIDRHNETTMVGPEPASAQPTPAPQPQPVTLPAGPQAGSKATNDHLEVASSTRQALRAELGRQWNASGADPAVLRRLADDLRDAEITFGQELYQYETSAAAHHPVPAEVTPSWPTLPSTFRVDGSAIRETPTGLHLTPGNTTPLAVPTRKAGASPTEWSRFRITVETDDVSEAGLRAAVVPVITALDALRSATTDEWYAKMSELALIEIRPRNVDVRVDPAALEAAAPTVGEPGRSLVIAGTLLTGTPRPSGSVFGRMRSGAPAFPVLADEVEFRPPGAALNTLHVGSRFAVDLPLVDGAAHLAGDWTIQQAKVVTPEGERIVLWIHPRQTTDTAPRLIGGRWAPIMLGAKDLLGPIPAHVAGVAVAVARAAGLPPSGSGAAILAYRDIAPLLPADRDRLTPTAAESQIFQDWFGVGHPERYRFDPDSSFGFGRGGAAEPLPPGHLLAAARGMAQRLLGQDDAAAVEALAHRVGAGSSGLRLLDGIQLVVLGRGFADLDVEHVSAAVRLMDLIPAEHRNQIEAWTALRWLVRRVRGAESPTGTVLDLAWILDQAVRAPAATTIDELKQQWLGADPMKRAEWQAGHEKTRFRTDTSLPADVSARAAADGGAAITGIHGHPGTDHAARAWAARLAVLEEQAAAALAAGAGSVPERILRSLRKAAASWLRAVGHLAEQPAAGAELSTPGPVQDWSALFTGKTMQGYAVRPSASGALLILEGGNLEMPQRHADPDRPRLVVRPNTISPEHLETLVDDATALLDQLGEPGLRATVELVLPTSGAVAPQTLAELANLLREPGRSLVVARPDDTASVTPDLGVGRMSTGEQVFVELADEVEYPAHGATRTFTVGAPFNVTLPVVDGVVSAPDDVRIRALSKDGRTVVWVHDAATDATEPQPVDDRWAPVIVGAPDRAAATAPATLRAMVALGHAIARSARLKTSGEEPVVRVHGTPAGTEGVEGPGPLHEPVGAEQLFEQAEPAALEWNPRSHATFPLPVVGPQAGFGAADVLDALVRAAGTMAPGAADPIQALVDGIAARDDGRTAARRRLLLATYLVAVAHGLNNVDADRLTAAVRLVVAVEDGHPELDRAGLEIGFAEILPLFLGSWAEKGDGGRVPPLELAWLLGQAAGRSGADLLSQLGTTARSTPAGDRQAWALTNYGGVHGLVERPDTRAQVRELAYTGPVSSIGEPTGGVVPMAAMPAASGSGTGIAAGPSQDEIRSWLTDQLISPESLDEVHRSVAQLYEALDGGAWTAAERKARIAAIHRLLAVIGRVWNMPIVPRVMPLELMTVYGVDPKHDHGAYLPELHQIALSYDERQSADLLVRLLVHEMAHAWQATMAWRVASAFMDDAQLRNAFPALGKKRAAPVEQIGPGSEAHPYAMALLDLHLDVTGDVAVRETAKAGWRQRLTKLRAEVAAARAAARFDPVMLARRQGEMAAVAVSYLTAKAAYADLLAEAHAYDVERAFAERGSARDWSGQVEEVRLDGFTLTSTPAGWHLATGATAGPGVPARRADGSRFRVMVQVADVEQSTLARTVHQVADLLDRIQWLDPARHDDGPGAKALVEIVVPPGTASETMTELPSRLAPLARSLGRPGRSLTVANRGFPAGAVSFAVMGRLASGDPATAAYAAELEFPQSLASENVALPPPMSMTLPRTANEAGLAGGWVLRHRSIGERLTVTIERASDPVAPAMAGRLTVGAEGEAPPWHLWVIGRELARSWSSSIALDAGDPVFVPHGTVLDQPAIVDPRNRGRFEPADGSDDLALLRTLFGSIDVARFTRADPAKDLPPALRIPHGPMDLVEVLIGMADRAGLLEAGDNAAQVLTQLGRRYGLARDGDDALRIRRRLLEAADLVARAVGIGGVWANDRLTQARKLMDATEKQVGTDYHALLRQRAADELAWLLDEMPPASSTASFAALVARLDATSAEKRQEWLRSQHSSSDGMGLFGGQVIRSAFLPDAAEPGAALLAQAPPGAAAAGSTLKWSPQAELTEILDLVGVHRGIQPVDRFGLAELTLQALYPGGVQRADLAPQSPTLADWFRHDGAAVASWGQVTAAVRSAGVGTTAVVRTRPGTLWLAHHVADAEVAWFELTDADGAWLRRTVDPEAMIEADVVVVRAGAAGHHEPRTGFLDTAALPTVEVRQEAKPEPSPTGLVVKLPYLIEATPGTSLSDRQILVADSHRGLTLEAERSSSSWTAAVSVAPELVANLRPWLAALAAHGSAGAALGEVFPSATVPLDGVRIRPAVPDAHPFGGLSARYTSTSPMAGLYEALRDAPGGWPVKALRFGTTLAGRYLAERGGADTDVEVLSALPDVAAVRGYGALVHGLTAARLTGSTLPVMPLTPPAVIFGGMPAEAKEFLRTELAPGLRDEDRTGAADVLLEFQVPETTGTLRGLSSAVAEIVARGETVAFREAADRLIAEAGATVAHAGIVLQSEVVRAVEAVLAAAAEAAATGYRPAALTARDTELIRLGAGRAALLSAADPDLATRLRSLTQGTESAATAKADAAVERLRATVGAARRLVGVVQPARPALPDPAAAIGTGPSEPDLEPVVLDWLGQPRWSDTRRHLEQHRAELRAADLGATLQQIAAQPGRGVSAWSDRLADHHAIVVLDAAGLTDQMFAYQENPSATTLRQLAYAALRVADDSVLAAVERLAGGDFHERPQEAVLQVVRAVRLALAGNVTLAVEEIRGWLSAYGPEAARVRLPAQVRLQLVRALTAHMESTYGDRSTDVDLRLSGLLDVARAIIDCP